MTGHLCVRVAIEGGGGGEERVGEVRAARAKERSSSCRDCKTSAHSTQHAASSATAVS